MAEPDLYGNGRKFSYGIGNEVIAVTDVAEGAESRYHHIGGVRNGPSGHNRLHAAVRIEAFQHIAAADSLFRAVAEECPRQAEVDFYADDLADPGNNNPRQKPENNAVHSEKENGRHADGIDEGDDENADKDGLIAEG